MKKKNSIHTYTVEWSLDGIIGFSYTEAKNRQSAVRKLKSNLKIHKVRKNS